MTDIGPLVGGVFLLTATVSFAYYTVWTLVTPFLDADSPVQALFPDRVWAIRLPVALLLIGLALISAFVGAVLTKSARKQSRQLTGGVKRDA